MTMNEHLHTLSTESVNPDTVNIDSVNTEKMLALINEQDKKVALAVEKEIAKIALVVDKVYEKIMNGGRLIYVGAGTSGRLGVLDASECPPTYGTHPSLVVGIIAGGDRALRTAVEGAEDDFAGGAKIIDEYKITSQDAFVGITASGQAPFVLGAVQKANEVGAFTVGLCTNRGSKLADAAQITIAPDVGQEVVMGSTRMKSGTAQKLVLNMISTGVMIKYGKTYGNLMVDLKATNSKLVDRAKRIICKITDSDYETAEKYLQLAGNDTKLAIMMVKSGLSKEDSQKKLAAFKGRLKEALSTTK